MECNNCEHLVFCHDENHHECEIFGCGGANCGRFEPKRPTIAEAMAGEMMRPEDYTDYELPF